MRRLSSIALLVGLACLLGFSSGARAGVTIDVLFQDGTGHVLGIFPGDPAAPGCTFPGYYGTVVTGVRCMDVVLTSTDPILGMGVSVTYDSAHGLMLAGMNEWKGLGVSFDKQGGQLRVCAPTGGLVDNSGQIQSFDCLIGVPYNPPVMAAGTYKIGTIIWNTSAYTMGIETISAYIDSLFDGMVAIIDGNVVDVSSSVVLGYARIVPEPGTAALLGLGLAGLLFTARRRRPPQH